jgi:hypothetical protein
LESIVFQAVRVLDMVANPRGVSKFTRDDTLDGLAEIPHPSVHAVG